MAVPGGTDTGVGKRRDHSVQPGLARAAVGIHKNENIEIRRQLFDRKPQVIDLFATVFRLSRDDHMGLDARMFGNTPDNVEGGIFAGRQDKENFIVMVIEFRQCQQVLRQPMLHSPARA